MKKKVKQKPAGPTAADVLARIVTAAAAAREPRSPWVEWLAGFKGGRKEPRR